MFNWHFRCSKPKLNPNRQNKSTANIKNNTIKNQQMAHQVTFDPTLVTTARPAADACIDAVIDDILKSDSTFRCQYRHMQHMQARIPKASLPQLRKEALQLLSQRNDNHVVHADHADHADHVVRAEHAAQPTS
jgi:hypothetical protein